MPGLRSLLVPGSRAQKLGDVGLAVLFAVANVVMMYDQQIVAGMHPARFVDAVVAVLTALPIAFRRRWPLQALGATCAATIVLLGTNAPEGSVPFTIAFLTYWVASASSVDRAFAGLAMVVAALAMIWALDTPGMEAIEAASFSALFSLVWAIGVAVRTRREAADATVRSEQERVQRVVERAERSVAEERLRIAQELHDVVAHSISVIAVQAGVGVHFVRLDVEKTDDALQAIRDTAHATLNELRLLLGALREEDEDSRMPSPGLDQLGDLVADVRTLGVPVEMHVDYPSAGRHPGLEMSVYRIVQESLTNVLRHAGQTTAVRVNVAQRSNTLVVDVSDDGDGSPIEHREGRPGSSKGAGLGLLGMHERVEVWGGDVSIGPRPEGGFAVHASFPLEVAP